MLYAIYEKYRFQKAEICIWIGKPTTVPITSVCTVGNRLYIFLVAILENNMTEMLFT